MLDALLNDITLYFSVGGYVMPPLMVATIILWYAIGYRISALRRGSKRSVRHLVEKYNNDFTRQPKGIIDTAVVRGIALKQQQKPFIRRYLDDEFNHFYQDLTKYSILILSIVTVAPIVGLLGTVAGMIETFSSLGDMTLHSQTGGIAGGISQALFTTQMGLAVAIPGLILERLLRKKQRLLQRELAQIKDILCSEHTAVNTQSGG